LHSAPCCLREAVQINFLECKVGDCMVTGYGFQSLLCSQSWSTSGCMPSLQKSCNAIGGGGGTCTPGSPSPLARGLPFWDGRTRTETLPSGWRLQRIPVCESPTLTETSSVMKKSISRKKNPSIWAPEGHSSTMIQQPQWLAIPQVSCPHRFGRWQAEWLVGNARHGLESGR